VAIASPFLFRAKLCYSVFKGKSLGKGDLTMTTQRWNDEMLDRLAEQVANLTEATTRAEKLAEGNARVIQALANAAAEAQEERKQILQFMAQQQTEIVGLRTETRRLMEMWFEDRGRNEGEDNSPS
jgi:hypothetical protein